MMEKIGLGTAKPYKDIYSLNSERVQCLGMIKDLLVGMVKIPRKFVMMDGIIANVPPTYGMLLSRQWGTFVGGSIQFELPYSIILMF